MKFVLFAFIATILFSCAKDQLPDPYAGDYECQVVKIEVMLGEPSVTTQYSEIFNVKKEGDYYKCYQELIHEDSVELGKSFFYYYGSGAHLNVRFEVDSLYVDYRVGGLGAYTQYHYAGVRVN